MIIYIIIYYILYLILWSVGEGYINPNIHIWRYSPFRALTSLIRRLHSSTFSVLLLHPLIPSSSGPHPSICFLVFQLALWWRSFRLKTIFRILSSSILTMWPAHPNHLILISSTMFGSLYRLWSSLFHLGRQSPPSCVGPYRVIQNDCQSLTTCHIPYTWDRSEGFFYLIEQHSKFLLHILQVLYMCILCDSTGLFKTIVGVLTTRHSQYTSDNSICVFLFNSTTLQVFVTYLTGALYVHRLWFNKHQHDNWVRSKLYAACQRRWFQWRFWFVPSVPRYLREEEEHKPDPWRNPIESIHMGLHLENEAASC